jgi:hypothetical protein
MDHGFTPLFIVLFSVFEELLDAREAHGAETGRDDVDVVAGVATASLLVGLGVVAEAIVFMLADGANLL